MSSFAKPMRETGFTMIEVLITLLIVAGVLFGTAALQAYGIKLTQGSGFREQAAVMAGELIERIEANNQGAKDGAYVKDAVIGMGSAPTCDASASACSPQNMAAADLKRFETNLLAHLPGVTAQITRVDHSPASPPAVPNAGPWSYTITITWQQTAHQVKGTTSASSVEKFETLTYTVTRTVNDKSSVL